MGLGHVALVTGAGRGIGAEIARRIGASGAAVVLGARTREECERVAVEIRSEGGAAAAVELDVGDPGSIARALAEAREWAAGRGELDWLVNNAGIAVSAPLVPRDGSGDELFERHMRINCDGARRVAEALLPGLRARGYGRIVNVASSAALRGYKYVSAYCASKHALLGWARAAADELEGTGVAVANVCPHYVDSPMTDESARRIAAKTGRGEDEARELLAAQNPGRRLVEPAEVAAAVLALLQNESNGAIVELDGRGARYHPPPGAMPQPITIPGWKAPKGYSNGVLAPAGARVLSIAGQVAWDAEQRIVGRDDFAAQFRQALANVLEVLRASGGAPEHLLQLTIYVTDKQLYVARSRELGALWKELCGRRYPAMALVEVAGLLEDGALVEIQGLAAIP